LDKSRLIEELIESSKPCCFVFFSLLELGIFVFGSSLISFLLGIRLFGCCCSEGLFQIRFVWVAAFECLDRLVIDIFVVIARGVVFLVCLGFGF